VAGPSPRVVAPGRATDPQAGAPARGAVARIPYQLQACCSPVRVVGSSPARVRDCARCRRYGKRPCTAPFAPAVQLSWTAPASGWVAVSHRRL